MDGEPCDPDEVYSPVDIPDYVTVLQYVFITGSTLVTVAFTPLIIFSPFMVPKLKTTVRRIIAMISLSDILNSVGVTIQLYADSQWKLDSASGGKLNLCIATSFLSNGFRSTSVAWSMMLPLYVMISLQQSCAYHSTLVFLLMSLFSWTVGLAPMAVQYLFRDPSFADTYLITGGCQFQMDFVYAHNGTACLADAASRRWMMVYYIPDIAMMGLTVLLLVLILFRSMMKDERSGLRLASLSESRDIADGPKFVQSERMSNTNLASFVVIMKLSLSAAIYVAALLPVYIKEFTGMLYGPDFWRERGQLTLISLFAINVNILGVGNLLLYGVCSRCFRAELATAYRAVFPANQRPAPAAAAAAERRRSSWEEVVTDITFFRRISTGNNAYANSINTL